MGVLMTNENGFNLNNRAKFLNWEVMDSKKSVVYIASCEISSTFEKVLSIALIRNKYYLFSFANIVKLDVKNMFEAIVNSERYYFEEYCNVPYYVTATIDELKTAHLNYLWEWEDDLNWDKKNESDGSEYPFPDEDDSEEEKEKFELNVRFQIVDKNEKEEPKAIFKDENEKMYANFNELRDMIHENAVQKGFWEEKPSVIRSLLLVNTELGEAYEALRSNKLATNDAMFNIDDYLPGNKFNNDFSNAGVRYVFEKTLKETFEMELSDTIIRLFDIAGQYNIDIDGYADEYYGLPSSTLNRLGNEVHYSIDYDSLDIDTTLFNLAHDVLDYDYELPFSEQEEIIFGLICDLLMLCSFLNIDIDKFVEAKYNYNLTRPYKHGKSF